MSARPQHQIRFLVLEASLRRGSMNTCLAKLAAATLTQRGAIVERIGMRAFDCPTYDGDVEGSVGIPEPADALRERIERADAFVIASPEYNASIPGGLKNAIDWVSRTSPQPFNGKQGLLMSASPSMGGGNRGLWALRVPLEHLGARLYPDMFSLAQAHQAFTDDGRIADAMLQKRFEQTIDCFMELVEAATQYPALKKQWVEFLGEHADPAVDRVETAMM